LGPVSVPPFGQPLRGFVATEMLFGNQIRLYGWKLEQRPNFLLVTLRWTPVVNPTRNYTIFVHLLDDDGRIIAQNDSQPSGGAFPTSTWEINQGVSDTHHIALDAVPSGQYRVEVGVYQASTGRRLSTASGDSDVLTSVDLTSVGGG
jgi:hypothetical protein